MKPASSMEAFESIKQRLAEALAVCTHIDFKQTTVFGVEEVPTLETTLVLKSCFPNPEGKK